MALVDQAVLKREQSEQEMTVCGGHDMAPIVVGGSGTGPASWAGLGIESRVTDYRKSALHLHPFG